MTAIVKWLTPARRKAIYGLVAAGIAVLLAAGVISPAQMSQATEFVVKVVAALTALMAFLNTNTPVPPPADPPTDDTETVE